MTNNIQPPQSAQRINELTLQLVGKAIEKEQRLELKVYELEGPAAGAKVIDFATGRLGNKEAGIVLSNICMGMMSVTEIKIGADELGLDQVIVHVANPLHACIGSQYAGWPLSHGKYFAMCSGPMRMARGKEEILTGYDLHQPSSVVVGVLESNDLPNAEVIQAIASECQVEPKDVCLCVARTASYPGSIQVVARSVETAMHKLHELKFDLKTITEAHGFAPLPPIPEGDDMTALGWTNDAMLYGAQVLLKVDTKDEAIEAVLDQIPSCSSSEFGTPFLEIFNRYDKDFYKIDKMLFSPAKIKIHNLKSGKDFEAGEIRNDILKSSFGLA